MELRNQKLKVCKLRFTGKSATLLGIGPMSPNLAGAFELSRDCDFPLIFIASQVGRS